MTLNLPQTRIPSSPPPAGRSAPEPLRCHQHRHQQQLQRRGKNKASLIMTLLSGTLAVACISSVQATAGANPSAQALRRVATLLDAWQVPLAKEALEQIQTDHGTSPVTQFLSARIRYLEGDYQDAKDLLGAIPAGALPATAVAELRQSVEQSLAEVQGFTEAATEDGHFLIRTAPGPDEILIPISQEVLPIIRKRVKEVLGYAPDDRIVVEFFPQVEALSRLTPLTVQDLEASGTIAVCRDNRLMLTSPRTTLRGYTWVDTLAHEYVHLIVTRLSMDQAPIWIHEGIARYVELAVREKGAPKLDAYSESLLAKAMKEDSRIGFARMSPSMAKLPTQEATTLAFAEVFSAMSFLHQHSGDVGLRRLLQALAEGASDRQAVAKAYGQSWESFEQDWLNSLKEANLKEQTSLRVAHVTFRQDGIPEEQQELNEVTGRVRDLAGLARHLEGRRRFGAAIKMYKKAEEAAQEPDPYIRNRLAFSWLQLDQWTEAVEALQDVERLFPTYGPTYKHLGIALAARGDHVQARDALEEALGINPFDPAVHHLLAQVYEQTGQPAHAQRTRATLSILTGAQEE